MNGATAAPFGVGVVQARRALKQNTNENYVSLSIAALC